VRVLILGGTSEARDLAALCTATPGVEAITSLAGATTAPRLPDGDLRVGGFGGADRLAAYLRAERITAVVDATHPFAAAITASAVTAAADAGVPLRVLRRPGWTDTGDRRRVPSPAAAADVLPGLGERVFLTTGRRSLGAFAHVGACWFLSRSVESPSGPVPPRLTVLLDRGPFTVDGERALLAEHRIDVLVTKDSGGSDAKLVAADERHLPVVMIDRPPLPDGVPTVSTAAEAMTWLAAH
jgi:precorrin-6A/cobalt-precorrin-6A reductase